LGTPIINEGGMKAEVGGKATGFRAASRLSEA
jgi:hypothetical protein